MGNEHSSNQKQRSISDNNRNESILRSQKVVVYPPNDSLGRVRSSSVANLNLRATARADPLKSRSQIIGASETRLGAARL